MPKQIKDFELKENIDGLEDLLIQDSDGITKRIKTSEFLNVDVDLTGYATETYVNQEIEEINMRIEELFQSVSNGKELLASALTDKGIPTLATESFEEIARKILSLGNGEVEELFNLITKNGDVLVTKNGYNLIYKGAM